MYPNRYWGKHYYPRKYWGGGPKVAGNYWPGGYFGGHYYPPQYWPNKVQVPIPTPVPPVPPIIVGGGHGRKWWRPWAPIWPERARWPRWLQDLLDEREAERLAQQQAMVRVAAIERDDEEIIGLL